MPGRERKRRERVKEREKISTKCRKIDKFFTGKKEPIPCEAQASAYLDEEDTTQTVLDIAADVGEEDITQAVSDIMVQKISLTAASPEKLMTTHQETTSKILSDNTPEFFHSDNNAVLNNFDNNNSIVHSTSDSIEKNGKHKTGFKEEWKDKFPWLLHAIIDEKYVLLCSLCGKHLKSNEAHKNSSWISKGFLTVRLDKVKEHEDSAMHKMAVTMEMEEIRRLEKYDESEQKSELLTAVESAMKCLDFLISHNLLHTTLFEPFVNFCMEELNSPVLALLRKAKNATYTSSRSANEFLEAMALDKEQEILNDINSSPCYSVLTDETSDVNNRKHMAVAIKYIKEGNSQISFVKDSQLNDGKVETIFEELVSTIQKCGNFNKMSCFTSDGASAMVGIHEGVASKVKIQNNAVITFNCMNHRLALATKDSFQALTRSVKTDEILTSTYKYYKYSSNRMNRLVNCQNLFGKGKSTTIKQVGFTRWLSHHSAVNSIRINYQSILTDLENTIVNDESSNLSGPTANGILKHFKSYEFFQGIHFLCDVLSVITHLNLTFQKKDADLSCIEPCVQNTLLELLKLKRKPGGTFCKKLDDRARQFGINAPVGQVNSDFEKDAHTVIDHLHKNISGRLGNHSVVTHLGVLHLRKVDPKDFTALYGNSEIVELADCFGMDEDDLLLEWNELKDTFIVQSDMDVKYLS